MKAQDIIAQLHAVLPTVTDLFTDNFTISSLTFSAGTVTAVTSAAHGLTTGKYADIVGATNPVAITTLTRSGTVASAETTTDHDLTLSAGDIRRGKTIIISSATESNFNGEFTLLSVDNRRNFTYTIPDSGATTATGSPLLENGSQLPGYNGRHEVTVSDTKTFAYTVSQTLFATAGGSPVVKTEPRISGAVTVDRADDAYTEQNTDKLWGFVVLDDVTASKNRDIRSDMTDTLTRQSGWKQRLSQPFSVFIFVPTSKLDTAGRIARDQMEDVAPALFRSLLGVKFSTGLFADTQYVVTFINHGFADYTTAYYLHEFAFEMGADITFDDTVGYDLDTAFRNIDLTVINKEGNQVEEATVDGIDLDDEPL